MNKYLIGPKGRTYSRTITFNGRKFFEHKQKYYSDIVFWDNSNIKESGCAVLALVNVLSGYVPNIDVEKVANIMKYGTFSRIKETLKYYGYKSEIVYKNDSNDLYNKALKHLNDGKVLIALVSSKNVVPFKFSINNHFIGIIGIEDNKPIILNSEDSSSDCTLDELIDKYMNGENNGFIFIEV